MEPVAQTLPNCVQDNPFNPAVHARLRRANLIDADGVANVSAVAVMATYYAALLFDDMCDFYDSTSHIKDINKNQLDAKLSGQDYHDLFVEIYAHYDHIKRRQPRMLWLIAGNDSVVSAFVDAYITKFAICCADMDKEMFFDES